LGRPEFLKSRDFIFSRKDANFSVRFFRSGIASCAHPGPIQIWRLLRCVYPVLGGPFRRSGARPALLAGQADILTCRRHRVCRANPASFPAWTTPPSAPRAMPGRSRLGRRAPAVWTVHEERIPETPRPSASTAPAGPFPWPRLLARALSAQRDSSRPATRRRAKRAPRAFSLVQRILRAVRYVLRARPR
jgi:hypothetical protein